MTDKKGNETQREEHLELSSGIGGKKVFVVDSIGNIINSFSNPTITPVGLVTLAPSPNLIGIVTVANKDRTITGNVTLSDSKGFIGLVTAALGLGDRYIGLVTATQVGLMTLAPSPNFIGIATVIMSSVPTVSADLLPRSFWQQASLSSGFTFYGLAVPNSNPTTSVFRLQRETLLTGEVLYGIPATFSHQWSSASLASITYL